jgi:hypothetical protein
VYKSHNINTTDIPTTSMFGPKTNIFVSICPGYEYQGQERQHLTPHHTWMLTVESTKYSLPGTHRRDPNPTHYSAVWNEDEDRYRLERISPTNFGIAGSILIQRDAPTSAQKLFDRLEAGLEAFPPELDGSEGFEQWIRLALHALQQENIVQPFDVEMFMSFSQAYLIRRMDGEGPARIAYSRMHKDHTQKEKKGFWVSYPQAHAYRDRRDVYGGLM